MNPNIYDFASTEYAQDAFIGWLCSCFNQVSNPAKASISKLFIQQLLGVNVPFNKVDVSMQEHNIDVLLTLDSGYYVIIEDKKYSSIHDNQLSKYINYRIYEK